VTAPAPLRRPDVRVTVDTPEDLTRMRELFARTGTENPTLRQIIEAAGQPDTISKRFEAELHCQEVA
jgi:spore coat polysaccharide biosynthesis protein SpsF (cytidylyltransferase family)